MLKHPDDCTKDQLDVRIVILLALALLAAQISVLSGEFTLAHAVPIGLSVYEVTGLIRARIKLQTRS